jgi:hypothetical protein
MEDTGRRQIRWSMFSCLTTHQTPAYPYLSVCYSCTSLYNCLTLYLPACTCTCLSTYLLHAWQSAFIPVCWRVNNHGTLKSIFTVAPCSILILSKFYIYQLMHKRTALKRMLKLTLKQLRHVSVQSPSSGSALFELAIVTVVNHTDVF